MSCSRVLLEKVVAPHLVKKFTTFYQMQSLVTVVTTAHDFSLSWAWRIHHCPTLYFLKIHHHTILLSTHRSSKWFLGPNRATKAQLLSYNRTQSRAVIGLFTGYNTLSRHLYVMWLSNNPTCEKCGTEGGTSVHLVSVWGFGFTQTCTFGFLLFEPWGY
jgi:hypothetical protein